jgi:HEAT repeat protein
MGLIGRRPDHHPPPDERRARARGREGLAEALHDPDPDVRRWAATDLAGVAGAVPLLAARVGAEPDGVVLRAVLTSLVAAGDEGAARALAPHIRCDDAALRNAVVEAMARMPGTRALVPELLADPDHDVRGLTVSMLAAMRAPQVPGWLLAVIRDDPHPNVCGIAVDELAEVGDPSMVPDLEALCRRFPGDAFLRFAVDVAVGRLGEGR